MQSLAASWADMMCSNKLVLGMTPQAFASPLPPLPPFPPHPPPSHLPHPPTQPPTPNPPSPLATFGYTACYIKRALPLVQLPTALSDSPSGKRWHSVIPPVVLSPLWSPAQCRHLIAVLRTAVPRLSTSCAVPPNMNKLAVVGQTPFGNPGTDPQQTPTPLEGQAKPGPLQVYETDRPFFGSTPVGGLDIMTSKQLIIPRHHLSSSSSSSSSSTSSSSSSSSSTCWVTMCYPPSCIGHPLVLL